MKTRELKRPKSPDLYRDFTNRLWSYAFDQNDVLRPWIRKSLPFVFLPPHQYGYIFAEGQRCQKRRPAIANPSSTNLLFLSINEVSFKNRQTNVSFNTDINDISLEMVKIKLRQTRSHDMFRLFLDHIDGETSWRDSLRLRQQRKANFPSFHLDTSLEGLGGN